MAEEVKVKDMLKFQQEKTTIEKDAREVVDPPFADAIRRGIRANKIKEETLKVEPTPERELNPRLPKMRNGAKEMRLTLDESLFREVKEEDKKLKNESLKENNQEDEELEECEWCHEKYNKSELREEKNLGLLCPTCIDYIESRSEGEDLEFLDEALEEKYFRVTYKDKKVNIPLVIMVKAENEEQAKEKFHKTYNKEKYETIGITEINEVEFNNWKRKGVNLLESLVNDEIDEFFKLCKKLGVETLGDLNRLLTQEPETDVDGTEIEKLRAYAKEINPRGLYLRNEKLEEKRVGKTKEVKVLQGNYGYGWEDLIEYEMDDSTVRDDFKAYRENEKEYSHRIIFRRVPNPEYKEEKLEEAHREESDSWEVEELVLYIRNDSEIYDRYTKPTVINLARKLNKGIFDKDLAAKAFLYVVDAGVRKYRKEFKAEDGYEQFRFTPATREDAAKKLLDMEMESIEDKAEDLKGKREFKEAVEDEEELTAEEATNHVFEDKGKITILGHNGYLGCDFYFEDGKILTYNFEIGVIVRNLDEYKKEDLLKHLKGLEKDGFKFIKSDNIKDTRDLHINNTYKVESLKHGLTEDYIKKTVEDKKVRTKKIKESYRVDPIRTNFDKTLKRENYEENFNELEEILGADELYGGNIEEIKNIRLYQYPEIYKDSVAVKYRYIFDALINGDFYPDDEETKWIRFDTNKMNKFGEHEFIVNAYYDDYGYSISEIDDGVYYVGDEYNCVKSITELLYNAGYEFIIESAEDILTDFTDAPIVDDEDLEENLTEAVEDKKVKFDYALIEFIEGGEDTDTESQKELRKAEKEQTKFTDLDELGDLIFRADEEVKELGEPGYDKLYVDFYGKADDGKEVRVHIYRVDLGDGLGRENHITNKDKEEIEEYLTKEYNKLEK